MLINNNNNNFLVELKNNNYIVQTCNESPTITKKELGSGGADIHLPSLSANCNPPTLLDLKMDINCGSVCSPNPVSPDFKRGHGG